MASSTELPALATSPQFIFFTDFDGTITQQDSNDFMFDHLGLGPEIRKQGFEDVLAGRRTFRDMFQEMMDGITTPFDQCARLLRDNITLDEGFREFYLWARGNNIPVTILSGGMKPVIRALLAHLIGEEEARSLQIVSSDVCAREGRDINDEGGWQIVYRDRR
jgi:2,3-diketo-5-methylthio-1-phosphopentane phosphatase